MIMWLLNLGVLILVKAFWSGTITLVRNTILITLATTIWYQYILYILDIFVKIQDSKAFIRQCTDINHIKQRNSVKKTNQNISWWVHVWRPALRPYGRYHKGHQKMFGSTGRIKISRYNNNTVIDNFGAVTEIFWDDYHNNAVSCITRSSATMILTMCMWNKQ